MNTWSAMKQHLVSGIAILTAAALCVLALSGCAGSGSSAQDAAKNITIGTMATEDILPMWVAENEGMFTDEGLNVTVQTFQSAQELSTAITAGEVDLAMTDVQVSAALTAGGCPMALEWVTLGTDASQGRFGIMTSPDSGITDIHQLAGVPIAVGSNTVPEYVMDRLMQQAGIADDQIVSEEVKKLPVRFEMMTSGQVKAAALPASLLALGEAQGMIVLADDTTGENVSQSVMAARAEWSNNNAETVAKLQGIWDKAAQKINDNPETYRSLLTEKANLSDAVAGTYAIATYPAAMRPTTAMVEPVLTWMQEKGYLEAPLTYDPATGALAK